MGCDGRHGDFAARHGEGAVVVPATRHVQIVVVGVLGDEVVNQVARVGARCQRNDAADTGGIRGGYGRTAHDIVEADGMGFGGADDGQGQVEAAACVGIGRVEMEQHVSTRSD